MDELDKQIAALRKHAEQVEKEQDKGIVSALKKSADSQFHPTKKRKRS